MSKEKALQFTAKIHDALEQLAPKPHEIEIDSILGYVRILYSTLKEIETDTDNVRIQPDEATRIAPPYREEITAEQPSVSDLTLTDHAVLENIPVENLDIPAETPEIRQDEVPVEQDIPEVINFNRIEATVHQTETPTQHPLPDNATEPEIADDNEPSTTPEVPKVTPVIAPNETTRVEESVQPFELEKETETLVESGEVKNSTIESPVLIDTMKARPEVQHDHRAAIDDLFRDKSPTGLVDFLGLSPLDDLRKAWGLNDKMLLIKDLFNNDGPAFEETLAMLNKFTSFEEARQYLSTKVIPHYEWYDLGRTKKAVDFITQVKRLFVKS